MRKQALFNINLEIQAGEIVIITEPSESGKTLKPDFSGQTSGIATNLKISVAERLTQLALGAGVVEAFNITSAKILVSESRQLGNEYPTVFYCGDDTKAKGIPLNCLKSVATMRLILPDWLFPVV
ncbi:MAG TPA: hypothetical protein V6C78_09195 [Crinalium sp.]